MTHQFRVPHGTPRFRRRAIASAADTARRPHRAPWRPEAALLSPPVVARAVAGGRWRVVSPRAPHEIGVSLNTETWTQTGLSEPKAARSVLEELLSTMMNQSQRKVSAATMDNPRILSLAACRTIHKILGQSLCPKEVEEVFPKLFLALLFQVSFITELKRKEVLICWKEYKQDQLTPIRSAVQSMRVLLRTMGFQIRDLVIEERGGWDKLLHVQHHLEGVRIVAREMMKTPRSLHCVLFDQLVNLLTLEDPTWEMVAMVMFTEMLKCTAISDTLDYAVDIFPTYLQSQCVGMPRLVLKTLYRLSERPDTAEKILTLMPSIMAFLDDSDDSDDIALALLVLDNLLPLLEEKTLVLSALAIAPKLRLHFDSESDTVRQLSICLFQYVMGFVTGAEKKKMKEEVWESLLPLVFHLHDQKENVAKAAQEALYFAGWFLKWQELTELALTAEPWEISKCLLERMRKQTKDFLHQSEVYLQSPQENLRQEAVRFIGLIGQYVDERRTMEYIKQVLEGPKKDPSPLVSSSVTQTVLMLEERRKSSRVSPRWLRALLPRAWRRRRLAPSRDLQKPHEVQ